MNDNGSDDLKKSDEWLTIAKNLKYKPATVSSDSDFGVGDLIEITLGICEFIFSWDD